jgi:hypothetical protein
VSNVTEPCRENGESIECELNKFDDMLAFMAFCYPFCKQVIAVDSQFVLFSRAWCIAEIHRAHSDGISQEVLFHSEASLSEHKAMLSTLRVENMGASRAEDKEHILAAIGDTNSFNEELRKLIIDENTGLIAVWLDGAAVASSIGLTTGKVKEAVGWANRQIEPRCSPPACGYGVGLT